MRKYAIIAAIVISVCALAGCGQSMHDKKVQREVSSIMEENPGMSESDALSLAEERVAEEEEIKKRLRNGEKIDGYEGYFECRKVVKDAGWSSGYVQIGDMVLNENCCMTPGDVREVAENSKMKLAVRDVFVAGYEAVEITDAKDRKLVTLLWDTVFEDDASADVCEGNYLCRVIPEKGKDYIPWSVDSCYLPGGYHYFYKDVSEMSDRPDDFKELSRDEMLAMLEKGDYFNGSYYNFGQDGCYYTYGNEYLTATFADNARSDKKRDHGGYEQTRKVSKDFKFIWSTDGKCTDIELNSSEASWVGSDVWYEQD